MIKLGSHDDLIKYFARCVDMHVPVALFITLPGCEKPELIVNQRINFEPKLEYYLNTYRDDLTHKFAEGVKIVGATVIQEIW